MRCHFGRERTETGQARLIEDDGRPSSPGGHHLSNDNGRALTDDER